MPVREIRDDFQTGTDTYQGTSSDRRLDAISLDYLTAHCVGPTAVGDPSAGLLARVWRVRATASAVYLTPANDSNSAWGAEFQLFSYSGAPIEEVDLAFDQNGAVFVCAERAGDVWMYWLDPRVGSAQFLNICPGRCPRVLLDDPLLPEESDVLLFYLSDATQAVIARQQQDLFTATHLVPLTGWRDAETGAVEGLPGTANLFLEEVGRASDFRLHLIASYRDPAEGRFRFVVKESAPYPLRQGMEGATVGASVATAGVVLSVLDWTGETEGAVPSAVPSSAWMSDVTIRVLPSSDGAAQGFVTEEGCLPSVAPLLCAARDVTISSATQGAEGLRPATSLTSLATLVTMLEISSVQGAEGARPHVAANSIVVA